MGLLEDCPDLRDLKIELRLQKVEDHWLDVVYESLIVAENNLISVSGDI